MNPTNVKKAIKVMTRVKERGDWLNMDTWQMPDTEGNYATTETQLHECKTAACLAGWVAVSPEFSEAEGAVINGMPVLNGATGDDAIAEWLDIDKKEANGLCGLLHCDRAYEKPSEEITTDDVIEILHRLRDTGTVYASGGN